MSRLPRATITCTYRLDPEITVLGARAETVHYALSVLETARCRTWDDLATLLTDDGTADCAGRKRLARIAGLALPEHLPDWFDRNEATLRGLRLTLPAQGQATVATTIIVCDTCHHWGFLTGSSVPTACYSTGGCAGRPVRVTACPTVRTAVE